MYWPVDEALLPDGHTIMQCDSSSGDKCHHDVTGISRSDSKRIVKAIQVSACMVCDDGAERAAKMSDLKTPQQRVLKD